MSDGCEGSADHQQSSSNLSMKVVPVNHAWKERMEGRCNIGGSSPRSGLAVSLHALASTAPMDLPSVLASTHILPYSQQVLYEPSAAVTDSKDTGRLGEADGAQCSRRTSSSHPILITQQQGGVSEIQPCDSDVR